MKSLATRSYTFQELLNRIDLEYWRVRHHGREQYTFIPLQYIDEAHILDSHRPHSLLLGHVRPGSRGSARADQPSCGGGEMSMICGSCNQTGIRWMGQF